MDYICIYKKAMTMAANVNNSMEPFFEFPDESLLERMQGIEFPIVDPNERLEILNEIVHEDAGINLFETDSNTYLKIKFAKIDFVNLKVEFHCVWVKTPLTLENATLTTELPFHQNVKFIEVSIWAKVGTDTFIPLRSTIQIEFNQNQLFNLVFLNNTQDGETSGVLYKVHSDRESSIIYVVVNKLKYAQAAATTIRTQFTTVNENAIDIFDNVQNERINISAQFARIDRFSTCLLYEVRERSSDLPLEQNAMDNAMVMTHMELETQIKYCMQFTRSTALNADNETTLEQTQEQERKRNKRVVPFTMQLRPRKNTYLEPCRYCASASSAYREKIYELYRKEEMIISLSEVLDFDKMGVSEEYYNPKNIIPTVILRKGRKFNQNCRLCIFKSIFQVPTKRTFKRSTKRNLNKRVKLSSSPTLAITSIQGGSEPHLTNISNSEVTSINRNSEDNVVIKRVKRGRPRTRGENQLKNGKRLLQAHDRTDNVTQAAKQVDSSRSLLKKTVGSIIQNTKKTVQDPGTVVIPNISSNISTIECPYNDQIQNTKQNSKTLQIQNTTEDEMENKIPISENSLDSSHICVKDLQKKLTEITVKTFFSPVKKSTYQALHSEEKTVKEANKQEQPKYLPRNVSTVSNDQNTYELQLKKNVSEHISIDPTKTDGYPKLNSMQNASILSTQPISAVATTQNDVPKFLENLTVINSIPSVNIQQVVRNNASILKRPCSSVSKVLNKKNKQCSSTHEIASIPDSTSLQRNTETKFSAQPKKGPIIISVTPVSGQQCKLPAQPLKSISPITSTTSIEHNDSQLGKQHKLNSSTIITPIKAVPCPLVSSRRLTEQNNKPTQVSTESRPTSRPIIYLPKISIIPYLNQNASTSQTKEVVITPIDALGQQQRQPQSRMSTRVPPVSKTPKKCSTVDMTSGIFKNQ